MRRRILSRKRLEGDFVESDLAKLYGMSELSGCDRYARAKSANIEDAISVACLGGVDHYLTGGRLSSPILPQACVGVSLRELRIRRPESKLRRSCLLIEAVRVTKPRLVLRELVISACHRIQECRPLHRIISLRQQYVSRLGVVRLFLQATNAPRVHHFLCQETQRLDWTFIFIRLKFVQEVRRESWIRFMCGKKLSPLRSASLLVRRSKLAGFREEPLRVLIARCQMSRSPSDRVAL